MTKEHKLNEKKRELKRQQTVGEEIANSVSHGVMAIFGIVAMILMIIRTQTPWGVAGAIIFGLSIFLLYAMSCLYHSLAFTKAKGLFKRFDHIGIYLLIGGTFAPALLLLPTLRQNPFFGWDFIDRGLALFVIQWTLITLGVVLKSIWVYKFQFVHIAVFLLLGWSSLLFVIDLFNYSVPAFWLVLAGGIAYSLGVVFYALSRKIKYFHFVWHLFVASGTILQFIAIYAYII